MKKEPVMRKCKHHGITRHIYEGKAQHIRCCKCRAEAVQRRRDKIKLMSIEYKGGKCQNCGYDRCKDALEFRHRNESQKDFAISYKGYTRSWAKVKAELDKCDLVCANCHREIHASS